MTVQKEGFFCGVVHADRLTQLTTWRSYTDTSFFGAEMGGWSSATCYSAGKREKSRLDAIRRGDTVDFVFDVDNAVGARFKIEILRPEQAGTRPSEKKAETGMHLYAFYSWDYL